MTRQIPNFAFEVALLAFICTHLLFQHYIVHFGVRMLAFLGTLVPNNVGLDLMANFTLHLTRN